MKVGAAGGFGVGRCFGRGSARWRGGGRFALGKIFGWFLLRRVDIHREPSYAGFNPETQADGFRLACGAGAIP